MGEKLLVVADCASEPLPRLLWSRAELCVVLLRGVLVAVCGQQILTVVSADVKACLVQLEGTRW